MERKKPMRCLSFISLFILMISACGGGGGGGGSEPALTSTCADVAGTWTTTEQVNATACGEGTFTEHLTYTITQNGCTITVVPQGTNLKFTGNVNGNKMGWSGSYPEEGGTTTINSLTVTISADGNSFSGSASWTWSDGRSSCSGTTQSTGTRVSTPVQPTVPTAPSALSATAQSSNTIRLTWKDNSNNESGFKIERGSSASGPFTEIANVGANITSYDNTGLNPSTTYYYRGLAYNANGNSAYTNVVSATTLSLTAPNAPSSFTATALSSTTIRLTWTDNANNETGFEIERYISSVYGNIATVGANITTYDHTGLTASTTYYYRLRAYNSAGGSSWVYANATTQSGSSTTLSFLPERDNVVMYNNLNASVANTVYSNTDLGVSYDFLFSFVNGYDVLAAASLLYFNVTSVISGKTIVRATLKLYPRVLPGDWNTVYRVYGLNASWSASTVTWNNCPGWHESPYAQKYPPVTTSLPLEWDVTQIVQGWANGSRTNYGFVIWDPNTTPSYTPALRITSFFSMDVYSNTNRRPILEIEYR